MDYKKYPANWREISLRIRARAGNRCEQCDAPNGAWIRRRRNNPAIWEAATEGESANDIWMNPIRVVLSVAHLNHDTTINTDDNLKALCQRCHLAHDASYHASNAKQTRARKKDESARAAGQLSLFNSH